MKQYKTDVRKDINNKQPVSYDVVLFKPVKHDPAKQRTMRPGKTARDKKSGAHNRRIVNQIKRAMEA